MRLETTVLFSSVSSVMRLNLLIKVLSVIFSAPMSAAFVLSELHPKDKTDISAFSEIKSFHRELEGLEAWNVNTPEKWTYHFRYWT